jgi:hypothetical protein
VSFRITVEWTSRKRAAPDLPPAEQRARRIAIAIMVTLSAVLLVTAVAGLAVNGRWLAVH